MQSDALAELLHRPDLGPGVIATGIALALGFGALHALSPGHGKTLVAAYLVGSRGTFKHAALLGASVTVTHTFSVFLIGIATLVVSSYVVPEKIIPVLGVISGLSIVVIGAMLFRKRLAALPWAHSHDHHHHYDHHHDHAHVHHGHDHAHSHSHTHDHDHNHSHAHDHDHHHHGPGGHSHVPEGDVTIGSLIALGASGGLVPCPSAMVLMLSAIALGRIGLGLVLLTAFSIGLAGVLVAIGALVLYAKHLLPDPQKTAKSGFFVLVPVLSAFVVMCIGLLMTAVTLGWVRLPALAL
jgi:nickel/cobalt transporter (NicO) family protein